MKEELKKLYELYEEYDRFNELENETLDKMALENRDATEEEKRIFEKRDALMDEIHKAEKLVFGGYFISFDSEREMEILEECSEEEWTNAINVFKEAVLKVDELTNNRLCFLFFEAALSKACTELWEK